MLRLRKRFVVILLMFILMCVCGTALSDNGSKGILYRVQNEATTVYLLGSIHVGNESMYPMGETLQKAMESADVFVFECDTESAKAKEAVLEMMYYTDGTQLKDVISAELYEKFQAVCKKLRHRERTFQKMRPWAAMSYFSTYQTGAEMGIEDIDRAYALGVEEIVRAFALQNKKEMDYLETTRGQMGYFDMLSPELQTYLLDETLSAILYPEAVKGMDATIGDWPTWWREGNSKKFAENYRSSKEEANAKPEDGALFQEYNDIMLTRRNRTMTDTIEGYLTNEKAQTYFVTVGLLHIVLEEDSIVEELQKQGYFVECLSEV